MKHNIEFRFQVDVPDEMSGEDFFANLLQAILVFCDKQDVKVVYDPQQEELEISDDLIAELVN